MESLTIGAFAKASRLSPKALRLYDELGLLTPARVDPLTGYRHYAPAQLERGLSTVVPDGELHRVLASGAGPETAVRTLVELANAAGGPDNVSCVVADVHGRAAAA